ncbi:hypothetical protein COY62_04330 [bacterium (Candidatus Howlettbacteria) CG_4_10_14_0_8_um_filter_40_9]|nr:MAG: hypothetical protein COY62_04330 [bacterium (Candidatus Howlettbacteria) CG_4_10_14_0_8_um_filter_40_9]
MLSDLTKTIYKELSAGNSVALIGATDFGKTWYVKNELIPFLESNEFKVKYFKDCKQKLEIKKDDDIVIVDEVETFVDREYLESRHPEEDPYYSEKYLEQVKGWHKKLKYIQKPAVFVITRNEDEEISYLVDNLDETDWGTHIKSIVFEK